MTKILVARHAESIANTQGIYQGQTYDTDLSPLGKKQAKALGEYMGNKSIDRIIASPLKRTMQTAHEVAKRTDLEIEVRKEIIETNHGAWEGKDKDWIEKHYPNEWRLWGKKPSEVTFPEGESYVQTRDRVMQFVLGEIWEDKTVVITHDNIVRILLCEAKNISLDYVWDFGLDPAGVTVFEAERVGGELNLSLLALNEIDHLRGLESDLSMHAL